MSVGAALDVFSSPVHPKRVRPTIRYLEDDLGWSLPPYSVDLCNISSDSLDHLRTICTHLSSIGEPLRVVKDSDKVVHRVVVRSRLRVVAWQEPPKKPCFCEPFLTWACAEGLRRKGDHSDCYLYFERLYARDQLLPTADDVCRHRLELGARVVNEAAETALGHIACASRHAGQEVQCSIAGLDGKLLLLKGDDGIDELYIVLDRSGLRRIGGKPVQDAVLRGVFGAFEKYLMEYDEISPTDYPGSSLDAWETSVKYGFVPYAKIL